jgi:hypothetical protein
VVFEGTARRNAHIRVLGHKKNLSEADQSLKLVVGDARLELAAFGSGDQRSILLS